MKDKISIEAAYEEMWKTIVDQVPLLISGGGGITYFGIPLVSLMLLVFSSKGFNFGTKFWWFLVWYVPYVLFISFAYLIANRNFKKRSGEKYDQAVLIYWTNNGVSLLILSVLFQSISLVNLQDGLGLTEREKTTAFVWYLLIYLLTMVILLLLRDKIFSPQAFLQRRSNQGVSILVFNHKKIVIGAVIVFSIAIIAFIFSGFQDFETFFIFLSSYLASIIPLFIGVVGIYRFVQMLVWRRLYYWK